MKIAINEEKKRIVAEDANRETKYFCPVCQEPVILKRGHIVSAHYAHKNNVCKDDWHHDMSEWHSSMQNRFPEDQREIVVKNNGKIHRADILSKNKVIEFQHSSISSDELMERNAFYTKAGYQISWVFDLQEEYNSGKIKFIQEYNSGIRFAWENPKGYMRFFPTPKKYDKDINIFLYWIDENEYENFYRVIWTKKNNKFVDFSEFIVSSHSQKFKLNECKGLQVDRFFMNHDDLLKERIEEANVKYEKKIWLFKNHSRNEYVCPKDGQFGLCRKDKMICSECLSCLALDDYMNGCYSYCCYPKKIKDIDTIYTEKDYRVPVY